MIKLVNGEYHCKSHGVVTDGIEVTGSGSNSLDGIYCSLCWIEGLLRNGMGVKKLSKSDKKIEEVEIK